MFRGKPSDLQRPGRNDLYRQHRCPALQGGESGMIVNRCKPEEAPNSRHDAARFPMHVARR
jgi:hypothetical protein